MFVIIKTHALCLTSYLAPSAPPENIRVSSKTSRSLTFAWDPPPWDFQNGIIRKYLVNITETASGQLVKYEVTSPELAIDNLHPYYEYIISLSAYTVSSGPSTQMAFFTDEEGKGSYCTLDLQVFAVCFTFARKTSPLQVYKRILCCNVARHF